MKLELSSDQSKQFKKLMKECDHKEPSQLVSALLNYAEGDTWHFTSECGFHSIREDDWDRCNCYDCKIKRERAKTGYWKLTKKEESQK